MNIKKNWKRFFTLDRHHAEGFTLVELIVVIAILAILGGVAVPAYSGYVEKAEQAADDALLASLNTAYAAACATNGENHIGRTDASAKIGANKEATVTVSGIDGFKNAFELFYESEAFKYYEVLGFDSETGLFVGNTVAAINQMLKDVWENSTFGKVGVDGQKVLNDLSRAFNIFSDYFSGNNTMFPDGFSIDGVIATLPEAVQNAFGFGSYDIKADQLEQLLSENVEGYAGWSDEEKAQWKEENAEKVNNIKGNAYVMNIANAANSGVTAEGIRNDISELMDALKSPDKLDQEKYAALIEECKDKAYPEYGLSAEMLAAVGASDVKNDSGISTLGAMYALAAGYLNSQEYKDTNDTTLNPDITSFPNVLAAMNHSGFDEYLNGKKDENGNRITTGNAVNDIDAYLNYMKYISANGVEMESGGAFTALGTSAWEIISGGNSAN